MDLAEKQACITTLLFMKNMHQFFSLAAALALALAISAPATATAGTDFYLKIDGVNGESRDAGHVGEIDVESFKAGIQQRGISDFGGGTAGKSEFLPIRIIKLVDAASPKLFLACALGQRIEEATLTAVRTGVGDPFTYVQITIKGVLVSSVNQQPGEDDEQDILLESVVLSFTKIEISYTPQNADGSAGTPVKAAFDVRKNGSLR